MNDEKKDQNFLKHAYNAFNARDIDSILPLLHPDVHWANGWEGGFVDGHDAVRAYRKRQWKEINPKVTPVSFVEMQDGKIRVEVRQVVKDLMGNILFNGIVHHIYTLATGKITRMVIEKAPPVTK